MKRLKDLLLELPLWAIVLGSAVFSLATGASLGVYANHILSNRAVASSPTPPAPVPLSQPPVLVRAVCSGKDETESRLEHIAKLQKGFDTQASAQQSQKGPEDFASSMAIISPYLVLNDAQGVPSPREKALGLGGSVTVYLGNGYFLAVTHAVTNPQGGLKGVNYDVRYFYRASGSENWSVLGAPLYDVTALVRNDLALLYTNSFQEWGRQFTMPDLPTGAELRFRSSTTLEAGEPVYLVTFNPKVHRDNNEPKYYSAQVVKGNVTSFSGPTQFTSNQFQTSIPVEHGQSGSLLLDEKGNLVGSLSAISKGGANRSSFARIEGLAQLLQLERNRLEGCLN